MIKSGALVCILQVLGAVVILAEFVIPSAGLLSIAAIGFIGFSLYYAYSAISPGVSYIIAGIDILMIPVLIWVGVRILAGSPLALSKSIDKKSTGMFQKDVKDGLVGKTAVALTDLRPAGRASLDGRRLDVVSKGDFIGKGSELKIVAVDGNRIVVNKI